MQRYRKLFIIVFSIICLLFNNQSFGNSGFGGGTTLVLDHSQYPAALKKFDATEVYILYLGSGFGAKELQGSVFRKDTIINYKKFIELYLNITGFRLIYKTNKNIDSVYQLDAKLRITHKAYILEDGMMRIAEFDSTMKKLDEFAYNYAAKLAATSDTRGRNYGGEKTLEWLLREYKIYDSYDRNNFAKSSVWILSIGIDDYGMIKYKTCKTDAQSYNDFFKSQFSLKAGFDLNSLIHEYVLLDKNATKEAILAALKDIAGKAVFNDYFIFNFSGCSNVINTGVENGGTNFFPYDLVASNRGGKNEIIRNRDPGDTTAPLTKCIPLKILQEYIQSIPAINQLFISEAGPSEKFKTEFIKTLLQNSPEVARTLNKNRIIIVPNGYGRDDVTCDTIKIQKGPINYYITSLNSDKPKKSVNIFDIFDEKKSEEIAYLLKSKAYNCRSFGFDYFDIFFERKFLKDYKEILGEQQDATRGVTVQNKEMKQTLDSLVGTKYALVVGTDNYQAKDWKKLNNPVHDARAVADELSKSYGFEVQLLEDKPRDSIYKAIREYYTKAKPRDQLVIYFAGHGDADNELLDDGFIVCSDSKPVEEDPMRNSYIPYDKIKKILNNIPAQQVLVLLDVCHGGTFDAQAFVAKGSDKKLGTYNITNQNVMQLLKDKLPLRTRKFLSSVGAEPAFDGQAGRHSPFANFLLQILRAKGRGSNGIITLKEIYAVLESNSLNETATLKISPQMNDFGNVDAFTEFIFIPVAQKEEVKK